LALARLGKEKGYTLVACDSKGINAFFIRDDLIQDYFKARSIDEIYKPVGYGTQVKGRYLGHPKSSRSMVDI
jgi:hypothetical protein